MTVARFLIFIGVAACIVGGIFFVLPGDFVFTGMIMYYVTTYGSFIIAGLGSNPNTVFFVEKSPTILLVITGLIFILAGFGLEIYEST